MAATTIIEKTRERLKAIVGATSGFTLARTKLGYHDLAATDEFWNDLASSGPFVIVRPALISDTVEQLAFVDFSVELRVYQAVTADSSQELTDVGDAIMTLFSELIDVANYAGTESAIPWQGISSDRDEEVHFKPRAILTKFTLKFRAQSA
jgi:hypothetical protein